MIPKRARGSSGPSYGSPTLGFARRSFAWSRPWGLHPRNPRRSRTLRAPPPQATPTFPARRLSALVAKLRQQPLHPLFRGRRLNAQVVGFDLARLGGRDMGEFGEGVEHHGDAQVAQRHYGRLPDAKILGVDQAEEGEDRARERERGRLLELAFDDEHGDGAENNAGERRAAAERLQALVQDAGIAELVEADRRRVGAGGAERAVDHGFAPGG